MANKKPITGNEGASLERQAWMAFVRREGKNSLDADKFGNIMIRAVKLLDFGNGRAKRNASIPGSLGRPKASKKAKPSTKS